MTNQERIQSHNDRLEVMKETVANLPDAGSGGGGSVETCTVTLECPDNIYGYGATGYVNGSFTSIFDHYLTLTTSVTLNDVVCGSTIVALTKVHSGLPTVSSTNGGTELAHHRLTNEMAYYIKAPTVANVSTIITMYDAD